MKVWITRASMVCLIVLLAGETLAQVDPAKALIGTWDGVIDGQVASGNLRTLIISSVKPSGDGQWLAAGRFGITGQVKEGPGGQEMSVISKDNEVHVEFIHTTTKAPVKLKLIGDNKLEGTIEVIERMRPSDRRIVLEKK